LISQTIILKINILNILSGKEFAAPVWNEKVGLLWGKRVIYA